jgi:hypothetical protein
MSTYLLTALALKAFSLNSATKSAYRALGNAVGGRKRSGEIRAGYVERADANLAFIERNGAISDGMRVLELGTGWVHWEALFTRLFYDVEVHLFDVWDNRQFSAFQNYLKGLCNALESIEGRDAARITRARKLADTALACSNFEEVYRALDMHYVIKSDGRLDAFDDAMFDLVFSSDVMEHIPASTLPRLAADLARTVKTGGHVAQQIVEADHLCIYAKSAHPKSYLQYSDEAWARWYENDVQYMNRWQHSDFVRLFSEAGFETIEDAIVSSTDTTQITIDERWHDYDRADLNATVTRLLVANRKDTPAHVA